MKRKRLNGIKNGDYDFGCCYEYGVSTAKNKKKKASPGKSDIVHLFMEGFTTL